MYPSLGWLGWGTGPWAATALCNSDRVITRITPETRPFIIATWTQQFITEAGPGKSAAEAKHAFIVITRTTDWKIPISGSSGRFE